jgi:hypothetical protein
MCILSLPDPPQTSKVLFVTSDSATLCQQQVHRPAVRRLLCPYQTRTHVISSLGSNVPAPVSPLSSSRRVLPFILVSLVHELDQNLDERHVRSISRVSPSRHEYTSLRRRPVDGLFLLRGNFKGVSRLSVAGKLALLENTGKILN